MDTCTDIIEEIISEEIVDETDQYEDNQSKRRAKRMTTAAVMRGCVFSLSYKQILIDGYIVASLRESVESNRQIRTPVSVRHCWECRLGFWKLVTSPQEGLDMEVSGLDHHAHNMQGAVQSIRRLCTCDRSRNSNRRSIFILCLGLYVRKDFLQASKSSVDADARSNSRSRVCGKEIIQHVLLFTLKPIKLAEVPKGKTCELTHLESKEMRVVCFWCKHPQSGSEVIHVVLPVCRHCRIQCIGAKQTSLKLLYLVPARRAYGMPDGIRKHAERLRANWGRERFFGGRRM